MEEMLNDKRFAHIAKDPKFKRMPKSERKIKIDKRFQSMFTDKKFSVKYTVDKRGRPVTQSSAENLRKYYDLSSSEEDSSDEEPESTPQSGQSKKQKSKKSVEKSHQIVEKSKKSVGKSKNSIDKSKRKEDSLENGKNRESGEAESDPENFSSNGSLLLIKKPIDNASDTESDEDSAEELNEIELKENQKQLCTKKKSDGKLGSDVKQKLRDLTIDYARGEGVLFSDSSSSDEESSEYEDDEDEIEHNWGELDKEAETTDEVTHRLAACNMDWDRMRAIDLMVLFNSFLPTGGLINSVTIYPSDFGLQRMKEEEVTGPIELVESKRENLDEDINNDEENEEGSSYHMEKLRQYQLNRLKYYYAVIDFDCANTANKIYSECDGLEYESSSTKLDLRFIPDDMTFDHEPKEVCDKIPDLTKYKPREFTTTALQQVKVDLTWDETDPGRQEISEKLNSGKLDDIDKTDIQAYLASGTSEDESEDEVKKQLEGVNDEDDNDNAIDKYKSLLKSIEQKEEEKKNKDIQLEFTWGSGVKEKSEKMVNEKMKQTENLTPFEQYLEKRKAKKIAKREQKKNPANDAENKSDSEDSVPSDVDMNDPYFAEELKNTKPKSKKRKKDLKNIDGDSVDEEEEKKRRAELELLLMEEDEESNKRHFSMKRIEEAESLTKSKKKRLSKKKKGLKEEASQDDFEVDVQDTRFNALFTSYHFNIDPADPHYRKTKGTEALINEKLKRRSKNDIDNVSNFFSHLIMYV